MTYTPKPDWYYAIVEDLIDKELERLENDEEYNKEREEMFQNMLSAVNPTDTECEVDAEKLEEAYTKSKETKTYEEDKDE